MAEAEQQELEVPSSRTGSRASETGSGLAGIPSGLVWEGGGGGGRAQKVDGSYPVEEGAGGTSCFRRKLELTTVRGQLWTEFS